MNRPSRPVVVAGLVGALVVVVVVVTVVRSLSGPEKTIEVYAASSLRNAYPEIAAAFEDEEDVAVDFTFGSASALALQLHEADPPDVFAGADPISLVNAGVALTGEAVVFTQNELVIVVPRGNPADVERVSDLASVTVAACDVAAPCGRLGQMTLAAAQITSPPLTAPDVEATLALVLDGTADAGLVYATDALAARDEVEAVELPLDHHRVAFYGISLVTGASDPHEGQDFIDFVMSEAGQDILDEHGFTSPYNPHLQPEE